MPTTAVSTTALLDLAWSALAGAVFGLALAAPPGPMNAVIAEESVLRGWAAGVRTGLGAFSADALFFLLTLLGVVTVVERVPALRAMMVGLGGLLMLYFALGAAREARGRAVPVLTGATEDRGTAASTGFRKAFVLALTNPYQLLFWLTIGVGLLEPGTVDVLTYTPYVGGSLAGMLVVRTGSPALLAGFFGGILVWVVSFPAALVTAQRRVAAVAPAVAGASAVVLAGFGVAFLWDALATVLG